jgi:hypothetical protein
MIVKCLEIYNQNTKQYVDDLSNSFLTKGFHYNVLEIDYSDNTMRYRLIPDNSGTYNCGILVRSQDFETVSYNIPNNWVSHSIDKDLSCISPDKWVNNSLWHESFFQDYFDSKTEALLCFKEELKQIMSVDQKYIQTMIDERPNFEFLQKWKDTMIPLFDEVRDKKMQGWIAGS